MMVVPGGAKGVENFLKDTRLHEAIRTLYQAGKIIAAVCAAPLVLQEAGVLVGRRVTCHPADAAMMTTAQWVDEPVVVDGNIVTSQGAGTCFQFALTLISKVDGPEKSAVVARGMVADKGDFLDA